MVIWKNIIEPVRPHMTIWQVHIACWLPKATHRNTHSEYVILIAFPMQHCTNPPISCYFV